jgi:nucleolar protein 12
MAKSKEKQPAKTEAPQKSEKSFIKVDKKAFDPTIASLFASSVRLRTLSSHPMSWC